MQILTVLIDLFSPFGIKTSKRGQEHELLVPLGPMPARGRSTTIVLGVGPLNLGLPLLGRSNVVLGAWRRYGSIESSEHVLLTLPVLLGLNMGLIHVSLEVLLEAKGPLHLVHQLAKP